MELKNKIAVITGATGGLGSAFTEVLDKEGVKCILIARNEEKLKKLISSLKNNYHLYHVVDFQNQEEIVRIAGEIAAEVKNIDILVNAMGIGIYKGLEDVSLDEWNDSIAVNLNAPFLFTKYLYPSLNKKDSSVVINIGSGLGKEIYHTNRIAYIASKFGLRGMSLALSKDHEQENIKFCYVALGSMLTDFGPGGMEERQKMQKEGKKFFTPEWVANKLTELIKEGKLESEITLYPNDYL